MKSITVVIYLICLCAGWVYITGCPGIAGGYINCGVNEPRALFVTLATGLGLLVLTSGHR